MAEKLFRVGERKVIINPVTQAETILFNIQRRKLPNTQDTKSTSGGGGETPWYEAGTGVATPWYLRSTRSGIGYSFDIVGLDKDERIIVPNRYRNDVPLNLDASRIHVISAFPEAVSAADPQKGFGLGLTMRSAARRALNEAVDATSIVRRDNGEMLIYQSHNLGGDKGVDCLVVHRPGFGEFKEN